MQQAAAAPLPAWESFYVIVGSAAAVLTGLMFIVITLAADTRGGGSPDAMEGGTQVFNTPTVVHFCAVLFVAAVLVAPWHELSRAGVLLAIAGIAGMAYVAVTARRLRRFGSYQAFLEDWLCYVVAPLVAYAVLVIAAILLPRTPMRALFVLGAVTLALLFIGLRNAWDVITYMAVQRLRREHERDS